MTKWLEIAAAIAGIIGLLFAISQYLETRSEKRNAAEETIKLIEKKRFKTIENIKARNLLQAGINKAIEKKASYLRELRIIKEINKCDKFRKRTAYKAAKLRDYYNKLKSIYDEVGKDKNMLGPCYGYHSEKIKEKYKENNIKYDSRLKYGWADWEYINLNVKCYNGLRDVIRRIAMWKKAFEKAEDGTIVRDLSELRSPQKIKDEMFKLDVLINEKKSEVAILDSEIELSINDLKDHYSKWPSRISETSKECWDGICIGDYVYIPRDYQNYKESKKNKYIVHKFEINNKLILRLYNDLRIEKIISVYSVSPIPDLCFSRLEDGVNAQEKYEFEKASDGK